VVAFPAVQLCERRVHLAASAPVGAQDRTQQERVPNGLEQPQAGGRRQHLLDQLFGLGEVPPQDHLQCEASFGLITGRHGTDA
jgi:hypothetical protein